MTWTESRSPVLGLLVKPFFRGIVEKWLFGIEMDKMVTNGGPQMYPRKAPLLSKDWGAPHRTLQPGFSFSRILRREKAAEAADESADCLQVKRVRSSEGIEDIGPGVAGFGVTDIVS